GRGARRRVRSGSRQCECGGSPEVQGEPRGVPALGALARLREPWAPPADVPPIERRIRARLDLQPDGCSAFSVASGFRRKDQPAGGIRWLLFGGKGGVGKSTGAAAVAPEPAGAGRGLVLATDPR